VNTKNIEMKVEHLQKLHSNDVVNIIGYVFFKNDLAMVSGIIKTDNPITRNLRSFKILHTPDKNRRLFVKLCFEYEMHLEPVIKAIIGK